MSEINIMVRRFLFTFVLMAVFASGNFTFADVKPAGVFGDYMVLQQDRTIPVWGTAAAYEKVTVKLVRQEKSVKTDSTGRWTVCLDALKAGGPFEMRISGETNSITFKDIYAGEVWLCSGQSNMDMTVAKEDRYWCGVNNEAEEVASANYPLIRVFDVNFNPKDKPQEEADGKWEICSPKTAGHFSAAGYFFARQIHKKLKVPVGLLTSAYGASTAEAWTSRPALAANKQLQFLLDDYDKKCEEYDSGKSQKEYEDALAKWNEDSAGAKAEGKNPPKKPQPPKNPHIDQHNPSVLYNGMVSPLVPHGIRGVLWYQGESNGPTVKIYDTIMETMINDWRQAWGQGDFPFLYVQLANLGKTPAEQPARGGKITQTREKQLKNLAVANTAMTVSIDIGDANNVHPKNKQDVGLRLSLQARAIAYGEEIIYSGPVYDYMLIDGDKICLHFKHIGKGLTAKGGKLNGFAIAGRDREFVWADAKIEGNTIVVSSAKVNKPVAVRYGWDENPITSLYSKNGLPASPFRTDDFE
jgi:sialate O-acetylesterase